MFACGIYPIFPKFLESVKKEAECNVLRLRHHPSLALLCGNNEDCTYSLSWDDSGGQYNVELRCQISRFFNGT
jgi:beta-mannosidase